MIPFSILHYINISSLQQLCIPLTFVPFLLIGLLVLIHILCVPSGSKVTDTFFRVLLPQCGQKICKYNGEGLCFILIKAHHYI